MTPEQLKASILQYAIQGKLVEQRAEEGTAEELYKQIQEEKQKLIEEGKIRKEKPLADITDDEIPFDIPETWKWVRVQDIAFLNSGNQYEEKNNGLPYIKVADMNLEDNLYEIVTSSRFVSENENGVIPINSIIFPKRGGAIATNKKRVVRKTPIFVDSNTMGITVLIESIFDYIKIWFDGIDLGKLQTGSSVPQVNNKDIYPLLIPLPPVEEQRRIVAKIEKLLPFVDRYAEAYEKLEKFNAKFPEDMKKSILQYAIQGKLVEQIAEEGSAAELYQQIQEEKQKLIKEGKIKKEKPLAEITEDEIPFDIPESWKWVQVGDVCFGFEYGTAKKSDEHGKRIVLRMGNIQEGKVVYDKLAYSNDEDDIDKYNLTSGDLLFNRTNSKEWVGKTAIYKGEFDAIYAGYLVKFRPIIIDSEYLNYVMQSKYYWSFCQRERTDAIGQSNINAQKLKKFMFPLPPLEEQKRIVAKIEELLPYCDQLIK